MRCYDAESCLALMLLCDATMLSHALRRFPQASDFPRFLGLHQAQLQSLGVPEGLWEVGDCPSPLLMHAFCMQHRVNRVPEGAEPGLSFAAVDCTAFCMQHRVIRCASSAVIEILDAWRAYVTMAHASQRYTYPRRFS
jgi:hypothetical protein